MAAVAEAAEAAGMAAWVAKAAVPVAWVAEQVEPAREEEARAPLVVVAEAATEEMAAAAM